MEHWIGELAATLHAQSCHNIYNVLRQCMKRAVQQNLVRENPCSSDAVTLPSKRLARASAAPQLYLTASEVRTLADGVPPHYRLPVFIAALCGLRAGELWALRRCDVDPLHGRLHVRYALKEIAGRTLVGPPKTNEPRSMSVPSSVQRELVAALAAPGVRLRKIRAHGSHGYPCIVHEAGSSPELGWTDDAQDPRRLLLVTPTGHPVQHSNFYRRVFRPTVKQIWPAGHRLHALRWHDLRHTCASLSLAAPNGKLHVVKERLGHADIRMTINIYGHLLPSADDALADELDVMVFGATAPSNVADLRPAKER